MNRDSIPVKETASSRLLNWGVAIGCLLALLLLSHFFLSVFLPQPLYLNEEAHAPYDQKPMLQSVDPAKVARTQKDIMGFGSRFLGEPGVTQTGEYLEQAFKKAGLDVLRHEVTTASPVTSYREIYRSLPNSTGYQGDEKLQDVEIYPFMPNHLQPVTTGDAGITGELILATPALLATGQRFDDKIALIDAKEGAHDSTYGFNWIRYARAGFKAVILSDSEGLDHIPWPQVGGRIPGKASDVRMVSSVPVNFVRVAATPNIFKYVGETIRLRVMVRFVAAPNTTYYATFHAKKPAREALVILVKYDALSILPDLAPGPLSAIGPALALQLLEGLHNYKDSIQRDVVFVAYGSSVMGEDGLNHLARILQSNTTHAEENPLLRALGIKTKSEKNTRISHLQAVEDVDQLQLNSVAKVNDLFSNPAFMVDPEVTGRLLEGLDPAARQVFSDQFVYVVNSVVLEQSEPVLQRKLEFLRSPGKDYHGPEFAAYQQARRNYEGVLTYAGYSVTSLLKENPTYFTRYALKDRAVARFAELLAFHQRVQKQLEQEKAIASLFNNYSDISCFATWLVPAAPDADANEILGLQIPQSAFLTPRGEGVLNILSNAVQQLDLKPPGFVFKPPSLRDPSDPHTQPYVIEGSNALLDKWGYSTYTFFNFNRQTSYREYADPVVLPYMTNLESLRGSFNVFADSMLAMAHGQGPVAASRVTEWVYYSFGGQVLVSDVGQTVVPNYPLDGAVLANRSLENEELYSEPGFYMKPIIIADPYGKYRMEFNSNDWPDWWRTYSRGMDYSPMAAGYDSQGFIKFIKDVGDDGQRLFKSEHLDIRDAVAREHATIVTFRAAPVALLDLTNPQTMKDYTSFDFISADGLADFNKGFYVRGSSLAVAYLEPDKYSYVLLESGAPGNDLVLNVRAFLLGTPDNFHPTQEIDGPGYLVSDHPLMRDSSLEAARSMASVNGFRLALQQKYHMADPQMEEYQKKSVDLLDAAEKPGQPLRDSISSARDSLTYSIINHPEIRDKIVEAVVGIMWYLGLLFFFVFFFEKLVFGFTDVRRQIAAQVVIFLAVFFLLWLLHPAFAMVRSSLMILLGFVIILISGGLTILFSSKFNENLEELRKKAGKVSGAQVDTLGVMGTAFLLGLNNMHRRKVRTGLTCATLTLLTFVMISFTSVQNDISDQDIAIGKALYQGMLIKKDNFRPISDAEVFAFQSKYGGTDTICLRRFALGVWDRLNNKRANPAIGVTYQPSNASAESYVFNSILQLSPQEPLQDKIEMVTKPTWFTPEQSTEGGVLPVFIPDQAAGALGITKEAVEAGGVSLRMNGREVKVIGIFKAASLDNLKDLDGLDLKPFDLEADKDLESNDVTNFLSAKDDAARIPAARMLITPLRDTGVGVVNSSLVVSMPQTEYKSVHDQIVSFMEQTAQPIFYGLDGVAYKGERIRQVTLKGLIDLIIPLIIAALTVLNTMKGSVYERRSEIYVYNAVGIAPRYIFFMFMAEAMVYAVVGSVLGYLLSQGVGRILTELGWTGGLNMTYTSLSTIYASLAIMAAVFISTYFPAKSAMDIAKPTDDAGWKLPEPVGDELAFDLPFNFLFRGRMAILVFFDRFFMDHVEGGMGRFSSAKPRMVAVTLPSGESVPSLEITIWLKPFDLAVSQRLVISMPHDDETGLSKARITITRLSGARESWLRLNQGFVASIRRQLLHWRAVGLAEQDEMFEEARLKFKEDVVMAKDREMASLKIPCPRTHQPILN